MGPVSMPLRRVDVDFNWRNEAGNVKAFLRDAPGAIPGELLEAVDEDGTRRLVQVARITDVLHLRVLPQ